MRYTMWIKHHMSQATMPVNCSLPTIAIAFPADSGHASFVEVMEGGSFFMRFFEQDGRRYLPCWIATGAIPGSGLPFFPMEQAASPITKISGLPGWKIGLNEHAALPVEGNI